jgi:hypothetical protein
MTKQRRPSEDKRCMSKKESHLLCFGFGNVGCNSYTTLSKTSAMTSSPASFNSQISMLHARIGNPSASCGTSGLCENCQIVGIESNEHFIARTTAGRNSRGS